jgi:hypothetical protein
MQRQFDEEKSEGICIAIKSAKTLRVIVFERSKLTFITPVYELCHVDEL